MKFISTPIYLAHYLSRKIELSRHISLLAIACLVLFSTHVHGQTLTWDASGTANLSGTATDGSGTWSITGTNWYNGTSESGWTTGYTAVIGNNDGAAGTITVGSVSVAGIIFNAPGSGAYTLNSGTITLTSGTITDNNTLGATTINSVLAGSAGLAVNGAGSLILGGANTFSGEVSLNSGTLSISSAGNLPSGNTVTFNGGTLDITAGVMTLSNNVVIGSGSSGTISAPNANNSSGNITLTGNYSSVSGTLTLDLSQQTANSFGGIIIASANGPALGSVVNLLGATTANNVQLGLTNSADQGFFANTTLNIVATEAGLTYLAFGNGSATNVQFGALNGGNATTELGFDNRTGTITITGVASGTFAGVIFNGNGGGPLTLIKNGAGTQVLTGANGYTGNTVINAGTLSISSASNLPPGSTVTFGGGTLNITAGVMTLANNVVIGSGSAGTIAAPNANNSSGNITLTGNYSGVSGTLTLDLSQQMANSFGGIIIASANGPALGSVVNLLGATTANNVQLGLTNSADQGFFANTTLNIVATGAGLTYLAFGNGSATNVQFGALNGGNATTELGFDNGSNKTITITGVASGTFAGLIFNGNGAGPLTLVKSGTDTQVLTGANLYTGTTSINSGTLQIGNGGTTGSISSSSAISGSSGGVLAVDESGAVNLSNTISGGVSFQQEGTGSVTLGSNTYTGSTTVQSGTLILNGNSTSDGTGYTLGNAGSGAANITLQVAGGFNSINTSLPVVGSFARLINVTVSALGSGTKTINVQNAGTNPDLVLVLNGPVTLQGPKTQLFSTISGTGAGAGNTSLTLDVNGGAFTWTSNGTANTFSGNVHIMNSSTNAGLLQMQNNSYVSNIAADQNLMIPDTASVQLDANITWLLYHGVETIDGLSGAGSIEGGPGDSTNYLAGAQVLTVGASNGSGTFSGTMTNADGTFSLGKVGTGTEVLTGSNTYLGSTVIGGGVLQIGNNTAAGSGGWISASSTVSGSSGGVLAFDWNTTGTFANTISGSIALTQIGSGTLVLTGSASYSGTTGVNSGALEVDGSLSGSSAVTVNAATLQGTGLVGGSVALTGSSTLRSSGNLTLAQGFSVSGSANTLSSGTITGNAAQHVGSTFAVNGILNGSDTLSAGASLSGIGFVGATILNGTDNLSSASTLTLASLGVSGGGNTISGGTVNATAGTTINSGGNLAVNGTLSGTVGVSGVLSGTGTLTGAVTVSAGGVTSPGVGSSTGVLTSDLAYSASSTANFNVSSGSSAAPKAHLSNLYYSQMMVTGGSGAVSLAIGNNVTLGANSATSVAQTGSQILGDGSSNSGVTLQLTISSADYATLVSNATTTYNAKAANSGLDNYFVFNLGSTLSTGRFSTLDIDVNGVNTSGTIYYATSNDRFAADGVGNTIGDVYIGSQEFALSYTGLLSGNSTIGGNDIVLTAIPEPSTWGMIFLGFGMLIGIQRLRSRKLGN